MSSVGNSRVQALACCLALAVVVWIARYWYAADFGFYEDDHARVVPAIDYGWQVAAHHAWNTITGLVRPPWAIIGPNAVCFFAL